MNGYSEDIHEVYGYDNIGSRWKPDLLRRKNKDINILLALQDFRNGAGAFLAGFLSKMTWLVHCISDRVDPGKAICSVFHRHFHDEEDNAAYDRTDELLCCQPDIRAFN